MKTNLNVTRLVISSRWPFSTVHGNARYFEIPILDNDSLQHFVVPPDAVCYMMNLDLLDMYIKTEVLDVIEPGRNLNASSLNFVTVSLNLNEPPPDLYEPSANIMSSFLEFHSFTSFLSQNTTPQIDVPSNRYGHGCTNFARVEADAYAGEGGDDSDGDASNDAYESDEMSDSGDDNDNDNDQQPTDNVPQNTPFHMENI
ncbi:hypothetical protein K7X08_013989 [Anisodus acutangulus]|uniref:Uncharacterized protein n=1 Tax=Anisodus acutangulus TaxID=402998 RepID=A0A9Q1R3W0_9SOLA|nr:hypothetical protein K7X08_013989 [Anisodus acutangulus]